LGLSGDVLFRWRKGKSLPSLDMFLTFCSRLDLEPDDVLGTDAPKRLDPNAIRATSVSLVRAAPRRLNEHPDLKLVRIHLERALEMELPSAPALDHLAADIGVSSQLIRYHFPELARAICMRSRSGRQECRQASQH